MLFRYEFGCHVFDIPSLVSSFQRYAKFRHLEDVCSLEDLERRVFAMTQTLSRRAPDNNAYLSRGAIAAFIRHNPSYVPGPFTIYEDLHKRPPAGFAKIASGGGLEVVAYRDLAGSVSRARRNGLRPSPKPVRTFAVHCRRCHRLGSWLVENAVRRPLPQGDPCVESLRAPGERTDRKSGSQVSRAVYRGPPQLAAHGG
jgi:hypothetical protein